MNGDIDVLKSFEIEQLLNMRLVKQRRGHNIEYFI